MSDQASLRDISGDEEESAEKETSSEDWKSVKIGNEDYFERYSGDTPTKGNEDYWNGGIKWLSNSEVSDEQVNIVSNTDLQITEEGLNNCTAKIIPENSVILSCTASIGKVAINTDEMATNQQFNAFEIKKGFNPYFLANQLFYRGGELQAMGGSTTHNHLAVYVLEKFDLDKPPMDEQRRIASVLYNVDQAIQKTDEIIEQTQRVKKGLMQDLVFEAEGEDSEERRFGPKLFEVDPSWEKVRLKEVTEVITRGKQPEYADEGAPVINQECIYWDGFYSENTKTLDDEAAEDWKEKYFAKPGDVLINSTGKGTLGRATVFSEDEETAIDSHVTRVQPDQDRLDPRFFRYFLEHNQGQGLLYSMCVSGSTGQIELSKTKLQLFTFPLPSLEEQKEISEKLEVLDEKINKNQEYKEQLQRLKKGLMQDLLTGEVRTKSKDIEVLDEVLEVEG